MKNTGELRGRIEQAFLSLGEESEVARDIAFHMTDWDHNIDDLIRLYEQPAAFSDDQIQSIII
jgi:hypothetical protein